MDRLKRLISIPEAGIFTILLTLVITFQMINPAFLSYGNISGMLRALVYTGIVGVGLAICLISGTIDISVGAIAGLASVIFAKIVTTTDIPIWIAVIMGIGVGVLAGSFNAFVIIKLKVTPFIATISTMYVFRGLATYLSNGYSIYPLPDAISAWGRLQPLGISWNFFILVAIMIVAHYMLDHTVWGLSLRATGSDIESAFCCEVDVKFIQASAIITVGALSALAGIMALTILGAAVATLGTGWELIAIAACAIGGVSLFGYSGSMFGLGCGLLTIQVIYNGIITIGVSPYIQVVVVGLILLVSMIIDVRRRTYLNLDRI